jgi:hypothetical protein
MFVFWVVTPCDLVGAWRWRQYVSPKHWYLSKSCNLEDQHRHLRRENLKSHSLFLCTTRSDLHKYVIRNDTLLYDSLIIFHLISTVSVSPLRLSIFFVILIDVFLVYSVMYLFRMPNINSLLCMTLVHLIEAMSWLPITMNLPYLKLPTSFLYGSANM